MVDPSTMNGGTPDMNGDTETGYQILDQWQSQRGFVKIIHVGAGASGLLAAYKARKILTNYELICYEKSVFTLIPVLVSSARSEPSLGTPRSAAHGMRTDTQVCPRSQTHCWVVKADCSGKAAPVTLQPIRTHTPSSQTRSGLPFTPIRTRSRTTLFASMKSTSCIPMCD
jgi:hypothetical protein